jgi:hypothetical protein
VSLDWLHGTYWLSSIEPCFGLQNNVTSKVVSNPYLALAAQHRARQHRALALDGEAVVHGEQELPSLLPRVRRGVAAQAGFYKQRLETGFSLYRLKG